MILHVITEHDLIIEFHTFVTLTLNFRPFLNCMEADDPELIRELKENIVSPPSTLPYNFTQVQHRSYD
jgi:hypothetical protein